MTYLILWIAVVNTPTFRQQLGLRYESLALTYLEQQGLKLIAKNYSCSLGELDLILEDQDCLVFVEVRYRKIGWTQSLETITHSKQQRLINTAMHYLQQHRLTEMDCRFDVIGFDGDHLEWLQNAISTDNIYGQD
jgi:putative endonuclease